MEVCLVDENLEKDDSMLTRMLLRHSIVFGRGQDAIRIRLPVLILVVSSVFIFSVISMIHHFDQSRHNLHEVENPASRESNLGIPNPTVAGNGKDINETDVTMAMDCPTSNIYHDIVQIGYSSTHWPNCSDSACKLNEGHSPIEYIAKPHASKCHHVQDCVTVTVKTRHRLLLVRNLITSLHTFHPGTQVVIADELPEKEELNRIDSSNPFARDTGGQHIKYFQTTRGVGLGRQVAVQLAQTKYVLIADDDFVFTKKSNLDKLVHVLESTDASIVGGDVDDGYPYDGVLRVWKPPLRPKPTVYLYPGVFYREVPCMANCYSCDIIKNFFLARKDDILAAGGWDEKRLFYEHEDFFFQMRLAHMKVIHCRDVKVTHDQRDRGLHNERKQQFGLWSLKLKNKILRIT